MLDKRYVLGVIVIIGLIALAALWPELFPSDVEIENIDPKKLSLQKFQDKEITFDLKNYGSEDVTEVEIHVFSPFASPNFLRLHNETFNERIGADGGILSFSMKPASAYDSEGSEIIYNVELRPFINGEYTDSEFITINVVPSIQPRLPFDIDNNVEQIIFTEFNSKDFEIHPGEEKLFEFRVKSNEDGLVDNMKVDVHIVNKKTEFIKMEEIIILGSLREKGDQTGKLTISILASNSEGDEIKYQVYLILYEDNTQMDVEKINVILKPSI